MPFSLFYMFTIKFCQICDKDNNNNNNNSILDRYFAQSYIFGTSNICVTLRTAVDFMVTKLKGSEIVLTRYLRPFTAAQASLRRRDQSRK